MPPADRVGGYRISKLVAAAGEPRPAGARRPCARRPRLVLPVRPGLPRRRVAAAVDAPQGRRGRRAARAVVPRRWHEPGVARLRPLGRAGRRPGRDLGERRRRRPRALLRGARRRGVGRRGRPARAGGGTRRRRRDAPARRPGGARDDARRRPDRRRSWHRRSPATGPEPLAERLRLGGARVLVTADGTMRRGRRVAMLDERARRRRAGARRPARRRGRSPRRPGAAGRGAAAAAALGGAGRRGAGRADRGAGRRDAVAARVHQRIDRPAEGRGPHPRRHGLQPHARPRPHPRRRPRGPVRLAGRHGLAGRDRWPASGRSRSGRPPCCSTASWTTPHRTGCGGSWSGTASRSSAWRRPSPARS